MKKALEALVDKLGEDEGISAGWDGYEKVLNELERDEYEMNTFKTRRLCT